MKHKKRAGGNPLREYRRLQRELRQLYDPFTAQHCPGCAAPCCIKPTRVTPLDVALALGNGHSFPHLEEADPYAPSVEHASHRLKSSLRSSAVALPMADDAPPLEYCEYLSKGRCTFPNDLRPFGCTMYVCGPMYANLPAETLRRIRRLLRQLEDAHVALMRVLRD